MKFKEVLIKAYNDMYSFYILFDKFHKITAFSIVPRIKTMLCHPILNLLFLSNNLEKNYFCHVIQVSAKHFIRWLMQTIFIGEKHWIFFLGC